MVSLLIIEVSVKFKITPVNCQLCFVSFFFHNSDL